MTCPGQRHQSLIEFCDSKIGYLNVAILRNQNVGGLHVAMHNPLTVRVVQRFGDLLGELKSGTQRQLLILSREYSVQRLSRNQFHDDVRFMGFRLFADIEDGHDSGMRKPSRRSRFQKKSLAKLLLIFNFLRV